ncbi:MAG: hypothetical protein NW220_07265 [Leptolyngbyaceae cyanobacterium bins.349]|nr:hypothetical protein [Leptolyngbyaceae cyanobacterium bins.349]
MQFLRLTAPRLTAPLFIWLTAFPVPSLATQTTVPIDCGAELECFLNAAKTCSPARIDPKRVGFSRSERLEILGQRHDKCLYYSERSPIQHRGLACQFYTNEGLVLWLEMISRRRRVIYDSRRVDAINQKGLGQRTIETINGEDVAECLWR